MEIFVSTDDSLVFSQLGVKKKCLKGQFQTEIASHSIVKLHIEGSQSKIREQKFQESDVPPSSTPIGEIGSSAYPSLVYRSNRQSWRQKRWSYAMKRYDEALNASSLQILWQRWALHCFNFFDAINFDLYWKFHKIYIYFSNISVANPKNIVVFALKYVVWRFRFKLIQWWQRWIFEVTRWNIERFITSMFQKR